jgi:hypothetical protein
MQDPKLPPNADAVLRVLLKTDLTPEEQREFDRLTDAPTIPTDRCQLCGAGWGEHYGPECPGPRYPAKGEDPMKPTADVATQQATEAHRLNATAAGKPPLQLTGEDGNAFYILGKARRAAKAAGWTPEQVKAYSDAATAGNYDTLLAVTQEWFDVS